MSLLDKVSNVTEVSKEDILSTDTKAESCQARSLLFLMCKKKGIRPVTIMRMCHRRGWDSLVHSTVLKNISRGEDLSKCNKLFKELINNVK